MIDIYVYGLERFGPIQAVEYQKELEDCFAMLTRHPRIGRLSSTIAPGLRRHEHGSHVILYQEEIGGCSSSPSSTAAAFAGWRFSPPRPLP
ncbi:type II toxin-antitoxin system RelE/ParE family toxin [Aquamicrobium sp. LC103]|uniref:type II toxin-antitoxin system RelE/ParE family toxin n=1 Tax=Aquamicrobium sp. LC103 TaxID=1120658 RepID=UPI00069BC773|nr:type II toxin-antitoxin system RelE/ParE family toxin [Aquamicrobium sp. LC103]